MSHFAENNCFIVFFESFTLSKRVANLSQECSFHFTLYSELLCSWHVLHDILKCVCLIVELRVIISRCGFGKLGRKSYKGLIQKLHCVCSGDTERSSQRREMYPLRDPENKSRPQNFTTWFEVRMWISRNFFHTKNICKCSYSP